MAQDAGRLRPKLRWIENIVGSYEPGKLPAVCTLIFTIAAGCLFAILQWAGTSSWWTVLLITISSVVLLVCKRMVSLLFCIERRLTIDRIAGFGIIAAHNQSCEGLRFKVPWVPLVPGLSILANVALMVNLNPMTWVRFCIWMAIGNYFFFKT